MSIPSVESIRVANHASEQFERDGYLVLRQVFQPHEMAALEAEARTLWERRELVDMNNIRCRWQKEVDCDECIFDCFDPVIDIGPVSRRFAQDERILAPLRGIYDDEAHLFKDKLIFKRPGATGYGLHQDYISWPTFPESFITVLVPIDAANAENGATEVFGGYRRGDYIADRDGEYHELSLEQIEPARAALLEMQPGDVAFFGGFTPHRSGSNQSSRFRRQLYLSYNAGRDGGEQRDAHYREFHEWLRKKYAEYGKHQVYFR